MDPAQRSFVCFKLEPVHIHPDSHISNARVECMSSCRRFLRVTLKVELNVIGVGVGHHELQLCIFRIHRRPL